MEVFCFIFIVYVSHTLNVYDTDIIIKCVTDIIINITSSEPFIFTYYMLVRDYSNSSVKVEYTLFKFLTKFAELVEFSGSAQINVKICTVKLFFLQILTTYAE